MHIDLNKTVGKLTSEFPGAAEAFERLGIDYCCGGNQPLEKACVALGLPINKVVDMLEQADEKSIQRNFKDWNKDSLTNLVNYIVESHHTFTKKEIQRLTGLLDKVVKKHAENHPELRSITKIFNLLSDELLVHMQKEELILFPYIKAIEKNLETGQPLPRCCFTTVVNPVHMMMQEHETAGKLLMEIRELSNDLTPPPDACNSYRVLYDGLLKLEQDLHLHIHLENNVLFPRAIELEPQAVTVTEQ
ncbi:MAG: iron-sulfur cluster repair di-iron protein [Acidobacteriota bacterium]